MGYLKYILRKTCDCLDCLPSPCDDCCPGITVQSASRYASKSKYGFSEFQSSGTVARRYLVSTRTVSGNLTSSSYTPQEGGCVDIYTTGNRTSGLSQVSQYVNGVQQPTVTTGGLTESSSWSANCYNPETGQTEPTTGGGGTTFTPGAIISFAGVFCNTTTSPTNITTNCAITSGANIGSQTDSTDLTGEYATSQLIADMRAAMSAWTGFGSGVATASYSLSSNELSVSATEAKIKFVATAPVPSGKQLKVYYNRVFTPSSGSPTVTSEDISIAAGATESAEITLTPSANGSETIEVDHYECIDS